MSNSALTPGVRQCLLALQDTASLLSQTKTRLATTTTLSGAAREDPAHAVTAAGLNARASDIGNLLDSLETGVRALQAANHGITSLQGLVETAESIAKEALKLPRGYSTKASIRFTGTGTPAGPGGATPAALTTSKLNGGVYTFTNSTGWLVSITIGPSPSAFNPITRGARVHSLARLNRAMAVAGVNLSASISGTDSLTFASTDDGAGQVITASTTPMAPEAPEAVNVSANVLGGGSGEAVVDAVQEPSSQNARATLVGRYNEILKDIETAAQNAAFNGINLIYGSSRTVILDETGNSTLTIAGVTFDLDGLGLKGLTRGADFTDNILTGKALTALEGARMLLRAQASAFDASLSILKIRQDFHRNLISLLEAGSASLTRANDDAGIRTARTSGQSIALSALALASQSQRSVLKLLR